MKLEFLSADSADIPLIFEQAQDLIDRYEDMRSIDRDKVLSWVKRKIMQNIDQYNCVLCNGIKCAWYRLCEDGELDDLYVLPDFQSRGIGSLIMDKCIKESEKPMYLYVFNRNIRAIAFYQRFDFSIRESVSHTRLIMARNG